MQPRPANQNGAAAGGSATTRAEIALLPLALRAGVSCPGGYRKPEAA